MANDANDANDRARSEGGRAGSAKDSGAARHTDRPHTFGKGMTSPDSTEAVLDASTGEPDPRASGRSADPRPSTAAQDQDLEQDV